MDANGRHRLVLTGGPGGGKTTAADLFRRELPNVALVPEAATILFSGGFPRDGSEQSRQAVQRAIYHVQRGLEEVYGVRCPDHLLLCDRGTIDGAAYWPGGPDDFFTSLGTTLEAELLHYDAVIFFESAAVGGFGVESGNPVRIESVAEAAELDHRLRALWSRHPRFTLVPHQPSFIRKIYHGLEIIERIVDELREAASPELRLEPG